MILIEVSAIFDHVAGTALAFGASGHCHRVVLSGKLGNDQPIRLSALRKGIALMDQAAVAAPNEAKVLLLRAVTNEAFPAILGRREIARRHRPRQR